MTAPQSPKVTIGVPTRDRAAYLKQTLDSALAQTYPNIEIVVSDNASTDATRDFLSSLQGPRLRIILQDTNIGMVGNFNACLHAATGDFFLLLSDDDELAPGAIEKLVAPFLSSADAPTIGVVWSPCVTIDAAGKALWETSAGPARESSVSLLENLWFGHRGPRLASVLIRTADALAVGGYDDARFGALCDTGNWGQAALLYDNAVCVPQPLVRYRVHPSSGTGSAVCRQWQGWALNLHAAIVEAAARRGDAAGVARLKKVLKPLLANITVDVLLRGKGTPGWLPRTLRELWHSRRYLLTPYVARRVIQDGAKLFR